MGDASRGRGAPKKTKKKKKKKTLGVEQEELIKKENGVDCRALRGRYVPKRKGGPAGEKGERGGGANP